jgi:DNA-binding beta-propeller fold protein YncE
VAVDSSGQVYVANLTGGVTVYSKRRALIATITSGVSGPVGVAVALGGNIYVANNAGNNVTIYNSAFAQVGTITDPTLQFPTGLMVDAANDVWVLDGAKLHLYLDNGTAISSVAAGGATAINQWGSNVELWSAFYANGAFQDPFQNIGEALHYGVGFNSAFDDTDLAGGAAQDSLGQVYETQPNNNRVVIWAANGFQPITAVPTASAGYGIAVDSLNKRFYVAEPGINQVAVYSTVPPYKSLGVIK